MDGTNNLLGMDGEEYARRLREHLREQYGDAADGPLGDEAVSSVTDLINRITAEFAATLRDTEADTTLLDQRVRLVINVTPATARKVAIIREAMPSEEAAEAALASIVGAAIGLNFMRMAPALVLSALNEST